MLEVARLLQNDTTLAIGVDLVCFDAEDYGTPQWAEKNEDSENTWALGAQYWAKNLPENYKPQFGILLDMVGGQGAKIYQEHFSLRYAASIVDKVWSAARHAGFSSVFANEVGGGVTDDHVPVNEAGIPTVDIIPFYPDCSQSSFGPTWHTVNDDMEHLDINTLKAVGQTLVQVIYSE
jgi:Zn-dependent M28 family amino/carboxypeptidase